MDADTTSRAPRQRRIDLAGPTTRHLRIDLGDDR